MYPHRATELLFTCVSRFALDGTADLDHGPGRTPVVHSWRLSVRVDVPEAWAARLHLRAPARIRLPNTPAGSTEWLGEVEEIPDHVVPSRGFGVESCRAVRGGVVQATIRLFGDHSELRLHQRVDVEIDG